MTTETIGTPKLVTYFIVLMPNDHAQNSEDIFHILPHAPIAYSISHRPVAPVWMPEFLACDLTSLLAEPSRHKLFPCSFSLPPLGSLLLFHPVLLCCCEIVLTVLHCSLVWPQAGICWWQKRHQLFRQCIERESERRKIEWNA